MEFEFKNLAENGILNKRLLTHFWRGDKQHMQFG